ncbi:hypothetical protein ACN38_g2031 [Penicillium nordicum]|uniref:Uncharacterized protein n=1 Tax=Penicillium nordicum TaxID=229535 RepID=A0A0M8P810_9EURO|nr:hypothetical protein ACN38_g2031 [Penicillium nordicum]
MFQPERGEAFKFHFIGVPQTKWDPLKMGPNPRGGVSQSNDSLKNSFRKYRVSAKRVGSAGSRSTFGPWRGPKAKTWFTHDLAYKDSPAPKLAAKKSANSIQIQFRFNLL